MGRRKRKKIRYIRILILLLCIVFVFFLLRFLIKKVQLIRKGYNVEQVYKLLDKIEFEDCILKEDYNKYLIQIVNDKNFIEDNLCDYVKIFNEETGIKYKSSLMKIVNDDYYLNKNVKRYLDYYEKNNDFSSRQIVEDVNCNLDKPYYSNIKSSDLTKNKLVIVNKYYSLDKDYVPDDLVKTDKKYGNERFVEKEVYDAFIKLYNDIQKEGMKVYIVSPYRSYKYQENLYNSYVKNEGTIKADTFSARPGHSEHQTGLAIDISDGKKNYTNFGKTNEYIWMSENAHKYGFILRYPEGKEKQTGYMFEAWHYRYVGTEAANYIKKNGITFDEYYEFFLNK